MEIEYAFWQIKYLSIEIIHNFAYGYTGMIASWNIPVRCSRCLQLESALSGSAGWVPMSYQLSNIISITLYTQRAFLVAQTVRNLPAMAGWVRLGRSPGEGNENPLQCSCLENPRDGEAWWAAVYGVAQSRTRLKQLSSSSSRASLVAKW